jgi:5-methylcytosine-specific restriction endonuclease McrA
MAKTCWVEIRGGKVVRIVNRQVLFMDTTPVEEYPRAEAVKQIRKQVFDRTKGACEWCSAPVTEDTMHMHEKLFKSQGGEVSIFNSVGICADCHIGKRGVHGKLYFGESLKN